MDTSKRREYASTLLPDGESDVSSDGRTVWINRGVCLARFCPVSHEYSAVPAESADGVEYPEKVVQNDGGPFRGHWDLFVLEVKNRWGIEISPEHCPLYVLNET